MKSRRWGVYVYRQAHGAPVISLGIHIDLHTPTVDLHLLFWTVQIGRNLWEPDDRRVIAYPAERWSGHTDNCWHREVMSAMERTWTYSPELDLCDAAGCGHSGTVHLDGRCDECPCEGYVKPLSPSFTFEAVDFEALR